MFVTFGPETPEFTLITIAPFAAILQKSAYHVKYLRISWTYLDVLYRFGRRIVGMIIPIFVWWSGLPRMLLWQPVKFGGCSQILPGTTFTFRCLTTDCPIVSPLSNDWMAIFRLHCVQIMWASIPYLGVYAVKTRSFCRDLAEIWRRSSFVTLAFRIGLEDCNFNFSRVIGNHFCTSFGSVTPKFKT